jgi:hypothetical protein
MIALSEEIEKKFICKTEQKNLLKLIEKNLLISL